MKYTIDLINDELKQYGWKCVSQQYKNMDEMLEFVCNNGHTVHSPWKKIRSKQHCPDCDQNIYSQKNISCAPRKKATNTQRVFAVDQATHISGWAIMDNGELVSYGTYEAKGNDEIARDHDIKQWFTSMIYEWKPDIVAIEGIQFQEASEGRKMGVTVFQALARLQGILMEACYKRDVKYVICPTNTWRHEVGIKGKSRTDRKASARNLIKKWYNIIPSEDESDAICICKYANDSNRRIPKVVNWEE